MVDFTNSGYMNWAGCNFNSHSDKGKNFGCFDSPIGCSLDYILTVGIPGLTVNTLDCMFLDFGCCRVYSENFVGGNYTYYIFNLSC